MTRLMWVAVSRRPLDGLLGRETLNVLLKEVLAISKGARGWCGSCKKGVQVEIPDAKAVVSAMSELLVQAKGRPGPEADHEEQTVVNITYPTTCDHGEDEVIRNGLRVDDPVEAARIIAAAKAA